MEQGEYLDPSNSTYIQSKQNSLSKNNSFELGHRNKRHGVSKQCPQNYQGWKRPEGHQVQPSTYHRYFPTKPCPSAQHLHDNKLQACCLRVWSLLVKIDIYKRICTAAVCLSYLSLRIQTTCVLHVCFHEPIKFLYHGCCKVCVLVQIQWQLIQDFWVRFSSTLHLVQLAKVLCPTTFLSWARTTSMLCSEEMWTNSLH